jgi:hypothetical protein
MNSHPKKEPLPNGGYVIRNRSSSGYFNKQSQYHRLDGPAFTGWTGQETWDYNGIRYFEDDLGSWPLPLYLGYLKWHKNGGSAKKPSPSNT